MSDCLICDEPLTNELEGAEVCRRCVMLELPRLMANGVIAEPLLPCAFADLANTWAQAETRFWKEAARALHEMNLDCDMADEDPPPQGMPRSAEGFRHPSPPAPEQN